MPLKISRETEEFCGFFGKYSAGILIFIPILVTRKVTNINEIPDLLGDS
jgi:hypothetical protein